MESRPSNNSASLNSSSTSLFLQISDNERHLSSCNYYINDLSPHSLLSQTLQCSTPPPQYFTPKCSTDIPSNHPTSFHHSSPSVSACPAGALVSFPAASSLRSTHKRRRDWLSSLSQPSPSLSLSTPVPTCIPSSAPKLQGSVEGANAYRTALRLSDVIAALRVERSDSNQHATSGPELIQSCHVDTSPKDSLVNADELRQRICTKGQLNVRWEPEEGESEERGKPESVGAVHMNTSRIKGRKGFVGSTISKGIDPAARSNIKREVHIYSERERRQRMTQLYATLRSLLPKGKIKVGRCAVLTKTMEYIHYLREELDGLGKQKVEVLASMQADEEAKNNKPSSHTSSTNKNTLQHMAPAWCDMRASLQRPSEEYRTFSDENPRENMCENEAHDVIGVYKMRIIDEEKGGIGSQGARGKVKVRLFGEDAYITVHTFKKRGSWSNMLEVLQQLGIHILNVTLSTSCCCDSHHHSIHARVPRGCKLNSRALKQSIKAFVGEAQKS